MISAWLCETIDMNKCITPTLTSGGSSEQEEAADICLWSLLGSGWNQELKTYPFWFLHETESDILMSYKEVWESLWIS